MLCCGAAGGKTGQAEDISAAWLLFYVAAHIFDNVEDQDDPEAWYAEYGTGMALNTGCGLFFTATLALQNLLSNHKFDSAALEINRAFQKQMLIMSSGQHRDLTLQFIDLDQYWQIAEQKTGAFFELACWSGTRLVTDDLLKLGYYSEFGKRLGLLLQLLDDFGDISPSLKNPILSKPRELAHSFVIAYANTVFSKAQQKSLQDYLVLSMENNSEATRWILNTIQSSGVDLYLLTEIERQRSLALQALNNANPNPQYRDLLLKLVPDLLTQG